MTVAAGLNDKLHVFGADTLSYPNEFDIADRLPAFSQVFELYVSDGVSNRWSEAEWEQVIGAMMSNDTTNVSDDVFGVVWNYFVREGVDTDPRHAGIEFTIGSNVYTRIRIRMYDSADLPSSCPASYGYACDGYSFYTDGTNVVTLNATAPSMSMNEILGLGLAHELQHLCRRISGIFGYYDVNETLSTLAEYLVDSWRPHYYDLSYGAGVDRGEECEPWRRYDTEKCWIVYLYEAFKGNPIVASDDLVHRWINSEYATRSGLYYTTLDSLLSGYSDYDWLGGTDPMVRFSQLATNYLAAKFCNAASFGSHGEFGSGEMNTVRDLALFLDNCSDYGPGAEPMTPVDCPSNLNPAWSGTDSLYAPENLGCWNVRTLLPDYELNGDNENAWTTTAGIYTDGDDGRLAPLSDGSMDSIDVSITGTDYVVFRAGSHFEDGERHDLYLHLRGKSGHIHPYTAEGNRIKPVGWVIGYGVNEDTLQLHPETIQFVEPLVFAPATIPATLEDSTVASAVVRDFGGTIKAAVLAISVMPYGAYTLLGGGDGDGLVYEYSFGVSTPKIEAFSRVGGVLHAQPDTAAVGCPQGDADELVVTVALDPDFYDGPIAKSEFNVIAADTSELYGTVEADSDATLIDGMYRTTITLDEFGACGYGDLGVTLNGEVLGTVPVDMRSVDLVTAGTSEGIVSLADWALFGNLYTPPSPYNRCIDYSAPFGQMGLSDLSLFGVHWGHQLPGGSAPIASAAVTEATLRLDVQEENPLVGERRLWATLSIENIEPFTAMVVSLRSDHPRLRFVAWHADDAYPETTLGTEVVRDGVKQAFIGILGDGEPHEPVLDFGRVEFEVLGEDPLVLSDEDLEFLIADLEVVGGGLRSFSPLRLEKAEVQPTYHFELAQNVPNPFNPTTTIAYSLASDSDVSLAIFDVRGARVKTLVSGHETTGIHRVPWDGTNDRGVRVSSGVYFYRLIAGSFKSTKKMVLLR